jgi:hypothetical protein
MIIASLLFQFRKREITDGEFHFELMNLLVFFPKYWSLLIQDLQKSSDVDRQEQFEGDLMFRNEAPVSHLDLTSVSGVSIS